MAGAKKATRKRKTSARSPSTPTRPPLRTVTRSSSPSTTETARRLGISASALRRRARSGAVRAVVDARGRYHFPESPTPAHKKRKKRIVFKKKTERRAKKTPRRPERPAASQRPTTSPSAATASSPRAATSIAPRTKKLGRKKRAKTAKKSAVRKKKRVSPPRPRPPAPPPAKRKKKKKKRRAKKKIRLPVAPPRPPPKVPGPFGVDITPVDAPPPPRPPITPIAEAAERVGVAMRDYVMARRKFDRGITHESFYGLKHAFRQTYGFNAWDEWFQWIVDEWGLEDYIFDRESLRDS